MPEASSGSTRLMGRDTQRTPAQIELGRRVRALRKELGLSQMALAERVGLHFTFVSTVERGERNLSLASLLAIAHGLGVDLGELVAHLPDRDGRRVSEQA